MARRVVGSVVMGTLPAVPFILCSAVCKRCSHGYFFFFLFLFRSLLLRSFLFGEWFGSRLFERNRPEQFVHGFEAAPRFGYGDGIGGTGCLALAFFAFFALLFLFTSLYIPTSMMPAIKRYLIKSSIVLHI